MATRAARHQQVGEVPHARRRQEAPPTFNMFVGIRITATDPKKAAAPSRGSGLSVRPARQPSRREDRRAAGKR